MLERTFARHPFYARWVALLGLLLITALAVLWMPDRLHTYQLCDGAETTVIRAQKADPTEILSAVGRPLLGNDRLEITERSDCTVMNVLRSQMVTVYLDGEAVMPECPAATVGAVLEARAITLTGDDYVRPTADTPMQEGMSIHVVRVEHRELISEEAIPRQSLTEVDLSLDVGETCIDDEGADGLSRTTTYITYEDGVITDHTQVTEIVQPARAQRIRTGISHAAVEGSATMKVYTPPKAVSKPAVSKPASSSSGSSSGSSSKSSSSSSSSSGSYTSGGNSVSSASGGVLTTSSGKTYTYTQVLSCSATAYTTEGYAEKHNASGNIARVGTVAVDPTVIPLGTALYIVTDDGEYLYGYCIAEDTGGAVKGNIVDLFFNTLTECYAFGRRNCTVYVLG